VITDSAIYVDGKRTESLALKGTRQACTERGGFAWVEIVEPDDEELASVASEFGLPEAAVRDAVKAHHRPRADRYGETLLVVLRTARYLDQEERVEFGEIHTFLGRDFVVTVGHGKASNLEGVRRELEGHSGFLGKGTGAVLWAVVDRVVDGYDPVIDGLENDVEEIEEQVFGGEDADVSRRIYELSREVLEFRRAAQPLAGVLERLSAEVHGSDREVLRRMRGVHDRALRITERLDGFRELLQNILSVNLTIVSVRQNATMQRQNVQVQKISAWAAIIAAPTLISGIYGMNFRYMPELNSIFGYPYALAIMLSISGILYVGFKRAGWL
jgi:magnesium transporter